MRGVPLLRNAILAGLALWLAGAGAGAVAAATPATQNRPPGAADSAHTRPVHGGTVQRAPSGPPLSGAGSVRETAEGDTASFVGVEADPLVSNGLGSPLCSGALGEGSLSAARRRDCETSGFSAAGAPTGNYGIDVHIDTGLLAFSSGGLLSLVQDMFVTPLWMALVWSVHALVVMLEWCFTVDLLDSPASGSLGQGLREMQAAITDPWLAAVLAVASVLALYNGLIRRRVADTVGQAVAMTAMMVGGMWLIADPTGTVGALGSLANQASLGTLAVSARGTPSRPGRALADSMAALFSSAIEAPWCYLEFGDVRWCRDPARLDPRLHDAALKIAASESAAIGCRSAANPPQSCVRPGDARAAALERSATLLRDADTNGGIFLALPANGPARNSINQQGSLLRTICQSSEATHCSGATAAQAQFRTNGGTWSRLGGLLLITSGVLGMLLLFGFIALRLLGAAIFSLLYLLLAPAVILAPALGEAGRAVFRRWAVHLLSAVISKLLFSMLLGVVLAVLTILAGLEGIGWWTQWLLMSAFWWGAYARRHQVLAFAQGALGQEQRPRSRPALRALDPPYAIRRAAARARRRQYATHGELTRPERRAPRGGESARAPRDQQATRMLDGRRREGRDHLKAESVIDAGLATKRNRLARLKREREDASASGNKRREAELRWRARRVERELDRDQRELDSARSLSEDGRAPTGKDRGQGDREVYEQTAYLDAQARLPGSIRAARSHSPERRDYPELAFLVGLGSERYRRLSPHEQRIARLAIDRELALRKQRGPNPPGRPTREAPGVRPGSLPVAPAEIRDVGPHERRRNPAANETRPEESRVMRDAREVAARRKRQLGLNRP